MKFVSKFVVCFALFAGCLSSVEADTTYTGFLDTNASVNVNVLEDPTNGFNLRAARLNVDSVFGESKTESKLQLIFGKDAAGYGTSTPYIQQAYITQTFGPTDVSVGKFIGQVGYELPDVIDNLNYTRSMLYFNVPAYHLGAIARQNFSNEFSVALYAANENSVDASTDNSYDGGGQVAYLADGHGVSFNYFRDNANSVVGFTNKDTLSAYAYVTIHESVTLVGEYLNPALRTHGGSGYVSIPVAENAVFNHRYTYWEPDTAVDKNEIQQYTATIKITNGAVTNYLEGIYEWADAASYWNSNTKKMETSSYKAVAGISYSWE